MFNDVKSLNGALMSLNGTELIDNVSIYILSCIDIFNVADSLYSVLW